MYTIVSFYKFTPLPSYQTVRDELLLSCKTHQVKGTILISPEGINATISATASSIEIICTLLKYYFSDLHFKISHANFQPFHKMKVKAKKEIVTFREPDISLHIDNKAAGVYLSPQQWGELLQDPQVIVVDTRNHYEVVMGTFKGAINPRIVNFTELKEWLQSLDPSWRQKKIAMFCTGGVRSEKATAYIKQLGFSEVYHLQGGVLEYLEFYRNDPEASSWEGNLFVFDDRIALKPDLSPINS